MRPFMNMEMAEQIRKRIEELKQQEDAELRAGIILPLRVQGELVALQWVLDTFERKHN